MKKIFLILLLLVASTAWAEEKKCAITLMAPPDLAETENFISYVGALWEQGVVRDADLAVLSSFSANAADASVPNPIPIDRTKIDSVAAIHRQSLEQIILTQKLDPQEITEWARRKLVQRGVLQEQRTQMYGKTTDTSHPMTFHRLNPVVYSRAVVNLFGGVGTYKVTLTNSIEVMNTSVTQKMWVDVMGLNPSDHTGSSAEADLPVESITWWSAIYFANKLSEKHGFKPAYDLSEIVFSDYNKKRIGIKSHRLTKPEEIEQAAARGNLVPIAADKNATWEQPSVKINAPNGDIYQAEGYRLPTVAEQESVLLRAKAGGADFYGVKNNVDPDAYIWHDENSQGATQPVATRGALTIDGYAFFDLIGNVSEWSADWSLTGRRENKSDIVNPSGPVNGNFKIQRRGNAFTRIRSDYATENWIFICGESPDMRSGAVGMRLVRTVQNNVSSEKRMSRIWRSILGVFK